MPRGGGAGDSPSRKPTCVRRERDRAPSAHEHHPSLDVLGPRGEPQRLRLVVRQALGRRAHRRRFEKERRVLEAQLDGDELLHREVADERADPQLRTLARERTLVRFERGRAGAASEQE